MTETTNNILGENMLPLAEIAKPVFNITPRIAQRKAATNTLPVPAFRIGGTRKGPLYTQAWPNCTAGCRMPSACTGSSSQERGRRSWS